MSRSGSTSASWPDLGRQTSLTSSWTHQACSSLSRRTDSTGSSVRAGSEEALRFAAATTTTPCSYPRAARYLRPMRVGVDTGGTFTDVVANDGRIVKVLSTPDDPARAVRRRVDVARRGTAGVLAHGTTVATNALLEGKGAPVCLVTTRGFADVIEIARQARPSLYDHAGSTGPPRSCRARCGSRSVGGSTAGAARSSRSTRHACPRSPTGVDAVAVCLLHADLDPAHERAVAARAAGARGSTSRARTRCRPSSASTSAW